MDKSNLPKQMKKSSEAPWSPTHERSRLSGRAGTKTKRNTGLVGTSTRRTWVEGDNAQKPRYGKLLGLPHTNIVEGKDPKSGKPTKPGKFLGMPTGRAGGLKGKDDEKEY